MLNKQTYTVNVSNIFGETIIKRINILVIYEIPIGSNNCFIQKWIKHTQAIIIQFMKYLLMAI